MKEEVILDFKVEQGEALDELESTKIAIINLKKEQKDLNDQYKKGKLSTQEYARETIKLEGELKKQTTAYNTNLKAANNVETQFDKLIKTNQELTKEVKTNTEQTKLSVESIKVQGQSLDDLGAKFTGTTAVIGGATAVISGLALAYTSSAAGARDLESAQAQLSATTLLLRNRLADLVGADGKGGGILSQLAFQFNLFFGGIETATSGAISAFAQNQLKELELVELEAQRAAKNLLDYSEVNRQIRDDATKSFEERKQAAEAVDDFVNDRERVLIEFQERRLEALRLLQSQDEDNLEIKKEIRRVEFEIADIQEDSQGKRTEALNGIRALEQEVIDNRLKAAEEQAKIDAEQSEFDRAKRINDLEEQYQQEVEQKDRILQLENNNANKALENTAKVLKAKVDADKKTTDSKKAATDQEILLDNLKTQAALNNAANVINIGSQLLKEGSAAAKAAAIAVTTAQTISAATAALAPPPVGVGPVLGPILAAITVATGLANVAKISGLSFAAGGGSFMTKGPQLLMVGDNPGGVERVDVTPISGRGKTVVGDGMIKMAGGGSIVANADSARINSQLATFNQMKDLKIFASWTEGRELGNSLMFKEDLTTA